LEADEQIMNQGRQSNPQVSSRLEEMANRLTEHMQKTLDSYPEAIIADHRYGFIAALLKDGVVVVASALTASTFLTESIGWPPTASLARS